MTQNKNLSDQLDWRVHTKNLLEETLLNQGTGILVIPFKILGRILYEVGERASQLNDPILNELMCRLTIYEIADPESKDYDKKEVDRVKRASIKYKNQSTSKTVSDEILP